MRLGRKLDPDHVEQWQPKLWAVLIGLACGLAGGGTVVPLGPVFSSVILHAGSSDFGVLLTAFGVGAVIDAAANRIGVSLVQSEDRPVGGR